MREKLFPIPNISVNMVWEKSYFQPRILHSLLLFSLVCLIFLRYFSSFWLSHVLRLRPLTRTILFWVYPHTGIHSVKWRNVIKTGKHFVDIIFMERVSTSTLSVYPIMYISRILSGTVTRKTTTTDDDINIIYKTIHQR